MMWMSMKLHLKEPDAYAPGERIIADTDITKRVNELALVLATTYKDKQLLVVGLLKGSFQITSELYTQLHHCGMRDIVLSFMTVKSYTDGTSAHQEPRIIQDIDINPEGRHVL